MFFIASAGRKSKGYIAKKTLFSKEKTKAVSIIIGIPHFVYPRPFPDPGKCLQCRKSLSQWHCFDRVYLQKGVFIAQAGFFIRRLSA